MVTKMRRRRWQRRHGDDNGNDDDNDDSDDNRVEEIYDDVDVCDDNDDSLLCYICDVNGTYYIYLTCSDTPFRPHI